MTGRYHQSTWSSITFAMQEIRKKQQDHQNKNWFLYLKLYSYWFLPLLGLSFQYHLLNTWLCTVLSWLLKLMVRFVLVFGATWVVKGLLIWLTVSYMWTLRLQISMFWKQDLTLKKEIKDSVKWMLRFKQTTKNSRWIWINIFPQVYLDKMNPEFL